MKKNDNVLTEEFLAELYNAAINNNYVCSSVCQYMEDSFLPDREYQTLHSALKKFWKTYEKAPKMTVIKQELSASKAVMSLIEEIQETAQGADPDIIIEQFESFLKATKFKKVYKEIGKKFDDGYRMEAIRQFYSEADALNKFTLKRDDLVDVGKTFDDRLISNKERQENIDSSGRVVNRFYIDQLDEMNKGRNLRTQLTVCLAMSGVGKSHYARWVGYNAAYISGLNVLHIQLEGSSNEVLDAYSAALAGVTTFEYERGEISKEAMDATMKAIRECAGTLRVKAYPKFGNKISTMDIKIECDDYKKKYGFFPDVIVVDSLDLLNDASGRNWGAKETRFQRIAVAEDLKDLAGYTDSWVFATYQATIENRDWVNDEKNVLDGYNLSEAKGLQRPCTHLITLNQSASEEKEEVLRMHVAKARLFKKSHNRTFKICTNYDKEMFYDRGRSLNLPPE